MSHTTAIGQLVTTRHPHTNEPHYVYRAYDADGTLLYVGVTYNPPLRFHLHAKTSVWWPDMARVRLIVFPNRAYALEKEREAIWFEMPLHNKRSPKPREIRERHLKLLSRGGAA